MRDPLRHLAAASLLGIVLFVPCGDSFAAPKEPEATVENLEKINRKIEDTSRTLDEKRRRKEDLLRELEQADEDLSSIGGKIADVREKISSLDKAIAGKKREIDLLRTSVDRLEKSVRIRLSALYRSGKAGFIPVIFSDETPSGMARRFDYFSRIVRHDREELTLYRRQVRELSDAVDELAVMRRKDGALRDALQGEMKLLSSAHEKKRALLVRIGRDEEALVVVLDELKDRATRMQNLLKKLESSKTPEYTEKTAFFEKLKGKLPWPATGPLRVGFGRWRHPDLDTYYDSQGVEIEVGREARVNVVGGGRVVFANTFKGYGKLIIVDHGDEYYTLYARVARLVRTVGDEVKGGDLLAYSGYSGNERLYFEVRQGGTPLDPTAWLVPR